MSEVRVETDSSKPREDNKVTEFVRNILRNTQEAARRQREWNRQAEGINVIPAGWSELGFASASAIGNALGQTSRFLRGESPDPSADWGSRIFGGGIRPAAPRPTAQTPDLLAMAAANRPSEQPATMTLDDILSRYQFDPTPYQFDSTPYDNYINFLMERDAETQARIQAMYAELGESADANVQRVADIYDAGTANLGDIYGSAYGAVGDAYASAQQQAADQMARLGVEAAAPAVMDPMALSQAEALSGIEAQRASGLGATQQYGTTAQDFSSQMQQVAQQQGLEVTSSIMRDLQNRQAEAAFMREQARAEANREMRQAQAAFNPYARAMERMQLEQMMGAGDREMAEYIMRAEQLAYDRTMSQQDRLNDMIQFILKTNAQTNPRNPLDWSEAFEAAQALLGSVEQAYPYQF